MLRQLYLLVYMLALLHSYQAPPIRLPTLIRNQVEMYQILSWQKEMSMLLMKKRFWSMDILSIYFRQRTLFHLILVLQQVRLIRTVKYLVHCLGLILLFGIQNLIMGTLEEYQKVQQRKRALVELRQSILHLLRQYLNNKIMICNLLFQPLLRLIPVPLSMSKLKIRE